MAACAGVAAAVYVSPEVYSLPVYQEFASLRPPLGGRTRLVLYIILEALCDYALYKSTFTLRYITLHDVIHRAIHGANLEVSSLI